VEDLSKINNNGASPALQECTQELIFSCIYLDRTGPDDDNDAILKIWEKCEEESNSIEVVYKNDNEEEILTKVHFQFSSKVCAQMQYNCRIIILTYHSRESLRKWSLAG
jgi:hypothetical protein